MSDLNNDHNLARALHHVVRAMHDGECPQCHTIHPAESMRVRRPPYGWECPCCDFAISEAEGDAALATFSAFMEQNLAVFKQWRKDRANGEEA